MPKSAEVTTKSNRVNSKAIFALKTAIAVAISYIIPMALGWGQPHQGAIAIIVIATAGVFAEGLSKGIFRIIGTIAGATIGLILIALFPQDRVLYFLSLSLVVIVVVYLYYAFKGEDSVLMITLIVIVSIFSSNSVDDRFIYAIDRSWSTAFGIFVYALVNIFLFPESGRQIRIESAEKLISDFKNIFFEKDEDMSISDKINSMQNSLIEMRTALQKGSTEYLNEITLDTPRWSSISTRLFQITDTIKRLHILGAFEADFIDKIDKDILKEIRLLIKNIDEFWKNPQRVELPQERIFDIKGIKIDKSYSKMERAIYLSIYRRLYQLHKELRVLADTLNGILSPKPQISEFIPQRESISLFHWGDIDDIVATFISMMIFWSGLIIWILFNPPMGYMVAYMALAFSLFIIYTPINPLLLIFAYSLSFIFATVTYIWVLPNLHYWWELAIYMIGYIFLSFYLFPAEVALFFAFGLMLQMIQNSMYYDFSIFLSILMSFYLFLGLILFFKYIPFSNRAEVMFLKVYNRIIKLIYHASNPHKDIFQTVLKYYALYHLQHNIEKLKIWTEAIDYKYFNEVKKDKILQIIEIMTKVSDALRYEKSYHKDRKIEEFISRLDKTIERDIFDALFHNKELKFDISKRLDRELDSINSKDLTEIDIANFAEYLTLKQIIFRGVADIMRLSKDADINILKESRF